MLISKEIINLAMITFFELTDQMTRSGCWRVDVISFAKVSCQSTSAIMCQSVRLTGSVGLYLFLYGVFKTFLSLINCILVFLHEIYWQFHGVSFSGSKMHSILAQELSTISLVICRGCVWLFFAMSCCEFLYLIGVCVFFFFF